MGALKITVLVYSKALCIIYLKNYKWLADIK